MLQALAIRDMTLIEAAELRFRPGLNVLTGETGAGKSILLDCLGFVLAWRTRAEVRPGAAQGEVAAAFAIVTDARRREFAYTVYRGIDDDGLPQRTAEPALIPRDGLDARLAELGALRRDADRIPSGLLAVCAARALAAGREIGPADALYLRSPDVTLPAGPKKVGA